MTRPHDEALVRDDLDARSSSRPVHDELVVEAVGVAIAAAHLEFSQVATIPHWANHLARAALSAMEAASAARTIYSVQPWIDADGIHDGWQTGFGYFTHARTDAEAQMAHESREPNAPELRLAQAQITPWRPVEQEAGRPMHCCGKCPPLARGGYDCTCRDNPRCEGTPDD